MKRFIVLTLAVLLTIPALWADSYRDVFMKYMHLDEVSNTRSYLQLYQKQAEGYFPEQPQKVDSVISEYAKTQMLVDFADIFEPFFRNHVTEQDLLDLIEARSDPQYALLEDKSNEIMQGWNQSAEYMAFVNQLGTAINDITADKKPEDLPIPEDVSPEYLETFNRFYDSSGIDEIISQATTSITQMLSIQLYQSGVKNAEGKVNAIMEYIMRSTRTVLLSIYSKNFTMDDLSLMTRNTQSDAYRHSNEAVKEAISNPFEFSVNVMRKFQTWLEATYPQDAQPK